MSAIKAALWWLTAGITLERGVGIFVIGLLSGALVNVIWVSAATWQRDLMSAILIASVVIAYNLGERAGKRRG